MRTILSLIIILSLAIITGVSQIPGKISYQGYLTDNTNQPVTGNKMMRFKIYDAETGGNNLWTEDHPTVAVFEGAFQVQLGSFAPLNLTFDIPYWLGISVENEPELVPRTTLTSAAYSMNANAVKGPADSTDWNLFPSKGNVGIGTSNPQGKIDVHGDLKIQGGKPIVFKRYNNVGVGVTNYSTNMPVNLWAAAVVGIWARDGDIDEGGLKPTIIKARMESDGTNWRIVCEFASHSAGHEWWMVDVMFVRRELCDLIGY
jgi:hypothetical protein